MHPLLEPDRLAMMVAALVQFVLFLRWLYRRIRNDELQRAFVEDMAVNHLPHIYDALRRLCQKQGVELDEPPSIRWVDLNNRRS
jgi:hypothetical protein